VLSAEPADSTFVAGAVLWDKNMMPKEYTSVTNLKTPNKAETSKAWEELQQKLKNGISEDQLKSYRHGSAYQLLDLDWDEEEHVLKFSGLINNFGSLLMMAAHIPTLDASVDTFVELVPRKDSKNPRAPAKKLKRMDALNNLIMHGISEIVMKDKQGDTYKKKRLVLVSFRVRFGILFADCAMLSRDNGIIKLDENFVPDWSSKEAVTEWRKTFLNQRMNITIYGPLRVKNDFSMYGDLAPMLELAVATDIENVNSRPETFEPWVLEDTESFKACGFMECWEMTEKE